MAGDRVRRCAASSAAAVVGHEMARRRSAPAEIVARRSASPRQASSSIRGISPLTRSASPRACRHDAGAHRIRHRSTRVRRRRRCRCWTPCSNATGVTAGRRHRVWPIDTPAFVVCAQLRACSTSSTAARSRRRRSRLRLLIWSAAGCRAPRRRSSFRDLRIRVDMGWREWKVAVEYDGVQHWSDRRQRAWDIERIALLEAAGWVVDPSERGDDVAAAPHRRTSSGASCVRQGVRPSRDCGGYACESCASSAA